MEYAIQVYYLELEILSSIRVNSSLDGATNLCVCFLND